MVLFPFCFPIEVFPRKWIYDRLSLLCSGYGIAAQALTAVVKAHDGRGPQTMLTSDILLTLGLSSPDELIGYSPIDEFPVL